MQIKTTALRLKQVKEEQKALQFLRVFRFPQRCNRLSGQCLWNYLHNGAEGQNCASHALVQSNDFGTAVRFTVSAKAGVTRSDDKPETVAGSGGHCSLKVLSVKQNSVSQDGRLTGRGTTPVLLKCWTVGNPLPYRLLYFHGLYVTSTTRVQKLSLGCAVMLTVTGPH